MWSLFLHNNFVVVVVDINVGTEEENRASMEKWCFVVDDFKLSK